MPRSSPLERFQRQVQHNTLIRVKHLVFTLRIDRQPIDIVGHAITWHEVLHRLHGARLAFCVNHDHGGPDCRVAGRQRIDQRAVSYGLNHGWVGVVKHRQGLMCQGERIEGCDLVDAVVGRVAEPGGRRDDGPAGRAVVGDGVFVQEAGDAGGRDLQHSGPERSVGREDLVAREGDGAEEDGGSRGRGAFGLVRDLADGYGEVRNVAGGLHGGALDRGQESSVVEVEEDLRNSVEGASGWVALDWIERQGTKRLVEGLESLAGHPEAGNARPAPCVRDTCWESGSA